MVYSIMLYVDDTTNAAPVTAALDINGSDDTITLASTGGGEEFLHTYEIGCQVWHDLEVDISGAAVLTLLLK
jgi:hypothetical protein